MFFFKCCLPYPFEVNGIHKDQRSVKINRAWFKEILDLSFKKEIRAESGKIEVFWCAQMPALRGMEVGGAALCFVFIAVSNLILLDPLFLDVTR